MRLRRWFAQFLCGRRGHLEVTRRHGKRLQIRCFICDARIGPGMDFTCVAAPKPSMGKLKPVTSIEEWHRRHAS